MATVGDMATRVAWWERADAQNLYDALTAAIETDDWGVHGLCSLTACRAPLHPGPCKGWKHTLHLVSPGAWQTLEKSRVERLNHKRLAKIAKLKSEGKSIPPSLLKEIMPKANPGTPPPGWHPGDLAPGQPAHLADKYVEQAVSHVGQKAAQAKGAAHKELEATKHTVADHAAKVAEAKAAGPFTDHTGVPKKATPGKVVHGRAVKVPEQAKAPAAESTPKKVPHYTHLTKADYEALPEDEKLAVAHKVAVDYGRGGTAKANAQEFLDALKEEKPAPVSRVGIKGQGTVSLKPASEAVKRTLADEVAKKEAAKKAAQDKAVADAMKLAGISPEKAATAKAYSYKQSDAANKANMGNLTATTGAVGKLLPSEFHAMDDHDKAKILKVLEAKAKASGPFSETPTAWGAQAHALHDILTGKKQPDVETHEKGVKATLAQIAATHPAVKAHDQRMTAKAAAKPSVNALSEEAKAGAHAGTSVNAVPAKALTEGKTVEASTPHFTLAADRGKSGDGHYMRPDGSQGPWGKYGAAGLLMTAPGEDGKPRYLLIKNAPGYSVPGKWQLPGGAIDEKETPHQGAARELTEELSPPKDYLGKMAAHKEHVYTDAGWKYTTIGATAPHTFTPKHDSEIADAKWFTAEELAQLDKDGHLLDPLSGGKLHEHIANLLPAEKAPPVKIAEAAHAAKAAKEPSTPGKLNKEQEAAAKLSQGGTAKAKLAAYELLSKDDYDGLPAGTQAKIANDLILMQPKFLDPKKQALAKKTHAYLTKGEGIAPPSGAPKLTAQDALKQSFPEDKDNPFGKPTSGEMKDYNGAQELAVLAAKSPTAPDHGALDNIAKLDTADFEGLSEEHQKLISDKLDTLAKSGTPTVKEKAQGIINKLNSESLAAHEEKVGPGLAALAQGHLEPSAGLKDATAYTKFTAGWGTEHATPQDEARDWLAMTKADYDALTPTQQSDVQYGMASMTNPDYLHYPSNTKLTPAQQEQVKAHLSMLTGKPEGTTLAQLGVEPQDIAHLTPHGQILKIGQLTKDHVAGLDAHEKAQLVTHLANLKADNPATAAEVDKFAKFHGLTLPNPTVQATEPEKPKAATPSAPAGVAMSDEAKELAGKLSQNEHQTPKHTAITALTKAEYDQLPMPVQAQIAATLQAGYPDSYFQPKVEANLEKLYGSKELSAIPSQLLAYQKATDVLWPAGATTPNVGGNGVHVDALDDLDKATWDKADPSFREAATLALHNAQVQGLPGVKNLAAKVAEKFGIPKVGDQGEKVASHAEQVAAAKAATWYPSEHYLDKVVGAAAKTTQVKITKAALFHGTGNNYAKYKALTSVLSTDPSVQAAADDFHAATAAHAKAHAAWRAAETYKGNLVKAGVKMGDPELEAADKASQAAYAEFSKARAKYNTARATMQAKFDSARQAAGLTKRKVAAYHEGNNTLDLQKNLGAKAYGTNMIDAAPGEKSMAYTSHLMAAPHLLPGQGYKQHAMVGGQTLGGTTPLAADINSAVKSAPAALKPPVNASKAKPAPIPSYGYSSPKSYPHANPSEGGLPDSHFVAGHGKGLSSDQGSDIFGGKDAYVLSPEAAKANQALHEATQKGSAAHSSHVAIPSLPNNKGQRDAAKRYTSNDYREMNSAARHFQKTGSWGSGSYAESARKLYEAFKAGDIPKTSKPITVYRGFYDAPVVMGHDVWGPNMVGTTFTNHAFSSTSTKFGTAKGFSGANSHSSVVMRIHVPAGTETVSAAAGGHYGHEHEFILGPDTTYKIVADYGWHDGVRLIDVEVVPNAHTAAATRGSGIPPRSIAEYARALG